MDAVVDLGSRFLIVLALVVVLLGIHRMDPSASEWRGHLRRRLLFGLPWGTFVVVGLVLASYLFVQGGLADWSRPVTIPFRAWSYFYPLGVLTASFTHASPGHLIGNLVGTIAFASVAEYAWGHYPRTRGSSSFGTLGTNPFVRAFVIFPGVTIVVGVIAAALSIGPVIGFSSVVFAFAGFALVRYPIATVVVLLARRALETVRASLADPTLVAQAEPAFVTPWWSQIAIQGHALGLLVGVLAGYWYFGRRPGERPSPGRLWLGVFLFAVAQSLWAVYWFRGGETYVLYRGVGVVLVIVLASLVTVAVTASSRPVVRERLTRITTRHVAGVSAVIAGGLLLPARLWDDVTLTYAGYAIPAFTAAGVLALALAVLLLLVEWDVQNPLASSSRRQVAAVVLLLGLAMLVGPAIPTNLVAPADGNPPGETIDIRDYQVTYAENVTDQMVSVVELTAFGETTAVQTSGVIVTSEDRGIWMTAVSKERLAFSGRAAVQVGGVGWGETVVASRSGWDVVGNDTAYRVVLIHDDVSVPAHATDPIEAGPVVAGRTVAVNATAEGFDLEVTHEGRQAVGSIPAENESVTLQGLEFVREDRSVIAIHDATDTRVEIAREERYRGR